MSEIIVWVFSGCVVVALTSEATLEGLRSRMMQTMLNRNDGLVNDFSVNTPSGESCDRLSIDSVIDADGGDLADFLTN